MRNIFFILLISLVVACSERSAGDEQSYPWQIKKTKNGHTQVFGIELDNMPLGHAARTFKKQYQLGLFENKNGQLSLEAYFGEFTRAGLSGKLIVVLQADKNKLIELKSRSVSNKYQNSGEVKYILSAQDQKYAEQLIVTGLSYIPYSQLDKEMIEKRFGIPDRVIVSTDKLKHYIYTDKGLEIIQDDNGKELLQYVSPKNINRLLLPLGKYPLSN